MPSVSVVIPTLHRPSAVCRAITSALSQTFHDLEVVVVTEREDDVSVEAVKTITDDRVHCVINPERGGPAKARDFGVEVCGGTWVAFLDDDDEWVPEKLDKQLAYARETPKSIVTALSYVETPSGRLIRPTRPYDGSRPIDEWLFDRRTWFKGGERMLQTSSLLVPRELFQSLRFGTAHHEEWELVIRAVKRYGYSIVTVNEPLVYYNTGNFYAWEKSLEWVDGVRDLITPRAYSGFCLTVATQALRRPANNRAFLTFLKQAFRNGKPTARQIFAFTLIWVLPLELRQRIRIFSYNVRTIFKRPFRSRIV